MVGIKVTKIQRNHYPEVNMTDKERSATSLNTTSGFKHHRLKVYVQFPKALPDIESMNAININPEIY